MTRGNSIEALLISENAETVKRIRQLLAAEPEAKIAVGTTARFTGALERISAGGVDLVLLDFDLSEGTGLGVLHQLRERAPGTPVVVVVRVDDTELAIELLRHGAQDVLAKGTLEGKSLVRALRFAKERDHAERQQQITLHMGDIPDCIILHEGKDGLTKLVLSPDQRFKLDILIAPPGNPAAEVSGHDFAADWSAVIPADPCVPGQVIEQLLPDGGISWNLVTKPPPPGDAARVVGTFRISQEATDPSAVAEVHEMEERYGRLLNSVSDYVYTVTMQEGRVASTDHGPGCRAITGYSPEEFKTDPSLWSRIIHPEDREMVLAKVQQLIQWGVPGDIEHRLLKKSGRIAWVRNKQVPRYDSNGRLIAYDGLISDITERKITEELLFAANTHLKDVVSDLVKSQEELNAAHLQLIQAEKLQSVGRLAAGVAHEVKNPMAILQMGIQYLVDSPVGDDQTRDTVLHEMRSAADRANSVIENLQNFSSARELANRAVVVNQVIADALQLIRIDLTKRKVEVVTELAPNLPTCNLESTAIEQVLVNILTNSCHAMPNGGTISIRTFLRIAAETDVERTHGDRSGRFLRVGEPAVVMEVRDTGTGIPTEQLPHMFDLFYTTKETGKGQGLGLAVSKRIIDLHGGRITIANAPGGGSVVTILLPANPPTV